jgi:hypothetical protein
MDTVNLLGLAFDDLDVDDVVQALLTRGRHAR